jgi:hypothetical protein
MTSTLLETLENLPESLQQEVLHYAEYLAAKYAAAKPSLKKRSSFGSWKGQIIIADDFDAPLEEMQEYME